MCKSALTGIFILSVVGHMYTSSWSSTMVSCTFDTNDTCGWIVSSNLNADAMRWLFANGRTTGHARSHAPLVDASTNSTDGGYFYIVPRGTSTQENFAELISPDLAVTYSECVVEFSFYSYGAHIGQIMLEIFSHMQKTSVLWTSASRTANYDGWQLGRVGLGRRKGNFSLVFSKTTPVLDYSGIAALDDIKFTNCTHPIAACNENNFKCANANVICIHSSRVCDNTIDCPDSSDELPSQCRDYKLSDFESNFGDFHNFVPDKTEDDDYVAWSHWRGHGDLLSPDLLPLYDHTTGTTVGQCLHVPPLHVNKRALLVSKAFAPGKCTVRFYYYMHGTACNHGIYLHKVQADNMLTKIHKPLWFKKDDLGKVWNRAEVELVASEAFKIVFEASLGTRSECAVALDDVTFVPDCKYYTEQSFPIHAGTIAPSIVSDGELDSCQRDEYQCDKAGQCVHIKQVCDLKEDCPGGTDENDCVMERCSFDENVKDVQSILLMCGWSSSDPNHPSVTNAWKVASWGDNSGLLAVDHTLQTNAGRYILAEVSFITPTAALESRAISVTAPRCRLEFWYHLTSLARLAIEATSVSNWTSLDEKTLWMTSVPTVNIWTKAAVMIGKREDFILHIKAYYTVGDAMSLVAIDDVTFVNCVLGFCQEDSFRCMDGTCIPRDWLCDMRTDCSGSEDEKDCSFAESCDFETDSCSEFLYNDDDAADEWLRKSVVVASSKAKSSYTAAPAPPSGNYAIQTSREARLLTTFFTVYHQHNCQLRYSYLVVGDGDLEVSMKRGDDSSPGDDLLLQVHRGTESLVWFDEVIDLSMVVEKNSLIQITFGTETGTKPFMASLDNILLSKSCHIGDVDATMPNKNEPVVNEVGALLRDFIPCGGDSYTCGDGTCVAGHAVCNFRFDCLDFSDELKCLHVCTFEQATFCDWYVSSAGDQFAINLIEAKEASGGQLRYDHTTWTGEGHYALITEVRGSLDGLRSPRFALAGHTCVFSYALYIGFQLSGNLFLPVVLDKASGSISFRQDPLIPREQWVHRAYKLPPCSTNFTLVLRAIGRWQGKIGIDDLRFEECDYPPAPQGVPCDQGEFQCDSNHCIAKSSLCDLQTDCCLDGSDENSSICQHYYSCDFNQGALCKGIYQVDDDDFSWSIGQDWTETSTTGPSGWDHSFRENGYFIYIETSAPRVEKEIARIGMSLNAVEPEAGCKLRIWYHMFGPTIGQLKIYIRNETNGFLKTIGVLRGEKGDEWKRFEVALSNPVPFQLVIEGSVGAGDLGDIALDDLTLTPQCQLYSHTLPTLPQRQEFANFTNCDFEIDQCSWHAREKLIIEWRLGSGSTTSAYRSMAPALDRSRSSSDGHYMYVHWNQAKQEREVSAALRSPVYQTDNAYCKVQMYLYIFGEVSMDFRLITNDSITSSLWHKGSLGATWFPVTVALRPVRGPFALEILVRGSGSINSNSVTAIDDISFYDCEMPIGASECDTRYNYWCPVTKVCINSDLLCDLQNDCSVNDASDEASDLCDGYARTDFETGFGNWTQDNSDDDFDWRRFQGATDTLETGPSVDHTKSSSQGFYLYLETSKPQKTGDTAWLLSPIFLNAVESDCRLRLFYHMYGNSIGALSIYVRKNNKGKPSEPIWRRNEAMGDYWIRDEIALNEMGAFQIIIEGRVGESFSGDIAIDDLSLTPGCAVIDQPLPTPGTQGINTDTPDAVAQSGMLPSHLVMIICIPLVVLVILGLSGTGWFCMRRSRSDSKSNDRRLTINPTYSASEADPQRVIDNPLFVNS